MARIVCISDTHNQHQDIKLPEGDILVHAGDFTNFGKMESILTFLSWMEQQDFKHKLLICGNHELEFSEKTSELEPIVESFGVELIHNRIHEAEGLTFYGEPRSQEFFDWGWMYKRGAPAERVWSRLPAVDVLVTHGPPYGFGDKVPYRLDRYTQKFSDKAGCPTLLEKLKEGPRPALLVCGHIHEGHGIYPTEFGTTIVNAAIMNRKYKPVNSPIVVTMEKE